MKAALLGNSCLSCPGIISLVANLVVSVDATNMLPQEVGQPTTHNAAAVGMTRHQRCCQHPPAPPTTA
jgi:hypothetical protein